MTEKTMLRVLKGERLDPPPIWLMRQAGRYLPEYRQVRSEVAGFLELVFDPARAAEVTFQPICRYGFDAAILFSDILVMPYWLGQEVRFEEGIGPVLASLDETTGPLATGVYDGLSHGARPVDLVYETVDRLKTGLPAETTLIGFAGAPWTVATYMFEGRGSRDFIHAKGAALSNSDRFRAVMSVLTEGTIEYLNGQIAAGAEVVQVFESHAGVVPATHVDAVVIEPMRRIVEGVRARNPDIPIIGFPRGAGSWLGRYCERTGVDAVSLDSATDPSELKEIKIPLQGNLDPVALLIDSETACREASKSLGGFDGRPHIFNLGHGIVKETDPETVTALIEHIRAPRS